MNEGLYCSKPFTDLELGHQVHSTCCTDWLHPDAYVRGCELGDPWKIWNHPAIERLRAAVLENDTRYCRRCPWLLADRTPHLQCVAERTLGDVGPQSLADCVDRTCNLHCRSCRPGPATLPADWKYQRHKLLWALRQFGPRLEWYATSQIGDPFASPISMAGLRSEALADSPARLRVCTNGLLMPAVWPKLPHLHERLDSVFISIDAATGPTYERLRRGGSWGQLLRARRFLRGLRRTRLPTLVYQFCVQAENFREMPAFVDFAIMGGATEVKFTMLRRFGQTAEEYQRRSLANPDHPHRGEFLAMLDHPKLRDPHVNRLHLDAAVQQTLSGGLNGDRRY